MAITGNGLRFFPAYWRHDDTWAYRMGIGAPIEHHYGHTHLWLLGYDWSNNNQDAFHGQQRYQFQIKDLWGPRSDDPNQQFQYRVIGTPKWYWHVEEVWRRLYIQRWDERIARPEGTVIGRKGVRWDACLATNRLGPFREGNRYSPVFIPNCRTLPVEYYTNNDKLLTNRDHRVRDLAQTMTGNWNTGPLGARFPKVFDPSFWEIPEYGFKEPANDPTYPDTLYAGPTMEYRKVTQLNWERFPGHAAHDIDENNFGDGWNNDATIPFVNPNTGQYNSPFAGTPGTVSPFGVYHGQNQQGQPLVPAAARMRYRNREDSPPLPLADPPSPGGYDHVWEPFGLPGYTPNDPAWEPTAQYPNREPINNDARPQLSGEPVIFRNPYGTADGRWIQQCLGGIVRVRAVVTIEHKLGGRHDVVVQATQLIQDTAFAGTDQITPGEFIEPD